MSRPVAIITGTSSGIGRAIALRLLSEGWSVHGICRRHVAFEGASYFHTQADLTDTAAVMQAVAHIRDQHSSIQALINNAGIGYFAPHEELTAHQIETMIRTNLLAPLLLTKLLLRDLKHARGHLINISSFSAHESSSFGAAYAATKSGLRHFTGSIFEEARKSGLRVCTISPDITRSHFHDHASFCPEDDTLAAIEPECVANSVATLLLQREGTVVTEIVLRPQRLLLKKRPSAGSQRNSTSQS